MTKWIRLQIVYLPKGRLRSYNESHVLRTKMLGKYRGWRVIDAEGWTVIVCEEPELCLDHPLGRTLFVHKVDSLAEVDPFIDDELQTITVYPFRLATEAADRFGPRGAHRICETGMASYPREGWTHDSTYPLAQFLRLVYMDETVQKLHKYGEPSNWLPWLRRVYGDIDISNFGDLIFEEQGARAR